MLLPGQRLLEHYRWFPSLRLITACVSSTRISVSSIRGNNALEETPAAREISGVAGRFESLLRTTTAVVVVLSTTTARRRWATNGQSCRYNHLVLLAVVDVDLESRHTFMTSYTCSKKIINRKDNQLSYINEIYS